MLHSFYHCQKTLQIIFGIVKLSGGHARTLLGISDNDAQFELAEHVIEEGLSVRALEALVKKEQQRLENQMLPPSIPAPEEPKQNDT